MNQSASSILLMRPANFGFNAQTAVTNAFQHQMQSSSVSSQQVAQIEFDNFASVLREAGVDVHVFQDTADPVKPDAVFPNNWISFHHDGTVVLYPMCTPNRRLERRKEVIDQLAKSFQVKKIIDLSHNESSNIFLEGTGSIVFDHKNRKAYACLSERTDKKLFEGFSRQIGYTAISFTANDSQGNAIYHTNVMMFVAEKFAVACLSSIIDVTERKIVQENLENDDHEFIDISLEQMNNFAGNMLCVKTKEGRCLLVCSQKAYESLEPKQLDRITSYCELLPIPIPTIETIGGGSARCMMAEIFLPAIN